MKYVTSTQGSNKEMTAHLTKSACMTREMTSTFGSSIFPIMDSNIPANPAYGIYISQLVRYARICTSKADFLHRLHQVSSRLHRQGFKSAFLLRSLTKFFNRHGVIIGKFDTTLRELRTVVHE